MRVATVDGLLTLFYDGSKPFYNHRLCDEWFRAACHYKSEDDIESWDVSDECKKYVRERLSWQQIIVLDGVIEIPECNFHECFNIKRVKDTVIRIQRCAFYRCENLVFIKWSVNLEYVGVHAFQRCNLSSVFIPPRCREIGDKVFEGNVNLSILNIPQDAELGICIIYGTALAQASPIITEPNGSYIHTVDNNVNQWLKNMNNDEKFALHRACASFQPRRLKEVILAIVEEKGLNVFQIENSAGITPSRYLQENPYSDLSEKEIIHDYVMKMTGEVE